MRAAHHSSAYDWQRHAAMRGATSGSGMGHGRTLLAKPRARVDLGWAAFALISLLIIASVARWAL